MTTALNGRVRTLEREARRAAGCPACRGREVVGTGDDAPLPAWMDDEARCRGCGRAIKLVSQDAWDAL